MMDSLTALKLNVSKVLELSIKQNEKLTDIQKKLELTSASISSLAKRVDHIEEISTQSGRKESSIARRVPREISVYIKTLHASAELKFRGGDSFQSPHNERVAEFLEQKVREKFADQYTSQQMHRAVHRYYESRRRHITDSRPERFAQVARNKERAHIKAKKRNVHAQRRKCLKKSELKYWECVPVEAMSSEEEAEDGTIYRHKPSWRSEALDALITKLEYRIKKKKPARKLKELGDPVYRPTPNGLKRWMINPLNEMLMETQREQQSDTLDGHLTEDMSSAVLSSGLEQVTSQVNLNTSNSNSNSWEENVQDFSTVAAQLEVGFTETVPPAASSPSRLTPQLGASTSSSAAATTELPNDVSGYNSSTSSGIQSSHSKSALSPAPPRQQSFDLYLSDEGNDNDDDSDFSVGVNDDDHYD